MTAGWPRKLTSAASVAFVWAAGLLPCPPTTGLTAVATGAAVPGPEAAWTGHGELAFVSGHRLYVMNGKDGHVQPVSKPGTVATAPSWSPAGMWVAFLVRQGAPAGEEALWVGRPNGTDVHQVASPVTQFAWGNGGDGEMLAYSTMKASGASYSLFIGSPMSMPARQFGTYDDLIGFSWSPNGAKLAVGFRSGPVGSGQGILEVVPTMGSGRRTVFTVAHFGYAQPAGWWPDGRGLLFWDDPYGSASIAADGLALDSLDLSSGKAKTLATALVHDEWLAWSPSGAELAVVAGGDREMWEPGKRVEVCTVPAGACRPVSVGASGSMGMSPTWTSAGALVFTVAPTVRASGDEVPPGVQISGGGPWSNQTVESWDNTQRLFYTDGASQAAASSPAQPVAGVATGAHDAYAIPGGLLYVRQDGLWYAPVAAATLGSAGAGSAVRLAAGLPIPGQYGNFYGYIDWRADFAWHAT